MNKRIGMKPITMCGFYLDLDSNKETKNKKYKVTGNWNI